MPKWRVTFEVDLKDSIPAEEKLKPHDYPLSTWASQTVFDLVLNHALVAALGKKTDACVKEPEERDRILFFVDRQVEVCRQAVDTSRRSRGLRIGDRNHPCRDGPQMRAEG